MDKQHETLGQLLEQVLKKHPAFASNPIGDWKELVGDRIAAYSCPKSLKNSVLVVAVHDSVWKHHLELLKDALLEKINAGRPEPFVNEIVLKVGELPEAEPVLNPSYAQLEKLKKRSLSRGRHLKVPHRTLSPEEEDLLKSLPDADLRRMGKRLLQKVPAEDTAQD